MTVQEIALEMAKLQYTIEGLKKENRLLKSHNAYQEALINLAITKHDREILEDVKLNFKKGRMDLKEIEWLILTVENYVQEGEMQCQD